LSNVILCISSFYSNTPCRTGDLKERRNLVFGERKGGIDFQMKFGKMLYEFKPSVRKVVEHERIHISRLQVICWLLINGKPVCLKIKYLAEGFIFIQLPWGEFG